MPKKYLFSIFILIFFIATVSACTIKNNQNEKLIDMVKRVETLDNKYSNFYLTNNVYLKELDSLFVSNFSVIQHSERRYMPDFAIDFSKSLNILKEKNIAYLTDDELKEIRNITKDVKRDIEVQISKVYDDGGYKYIFSKAKIVSKYNTAYRYKYYTKEYTFAKENGQWKIQHIDNNFYLNQSEEVKNTTFKNTNIEYIEKLNPLL